MKSISKKMRQWILGSALVITAVLIWWVYVYSPLKDQREELAVDVSQVSQERDRLAQRLKRLSNKKQSQQEIQETLDRLSRLVVSGNSLEEVSAETHLWVQTFLGSHNLSLKAYKGLPPSKWRDYPLSRIEFQLRATTQGLSDLLENLEKIEKAIRIEKLGVNFRRGKENDLRISLHLSTLFVEGF